MEARRPEALAADPAKESFGLAPVSDPSTSIASFAASDAACIERDRSPAFGAGELGERKGEEVGDDSG